MGKMPFMDDMMKKPKLGSGGRFKEMVAKLKGQKDVTDPAALAASIGAKKYGKAKMESMAAAGRGK